MRNQHEDIVLGSGHFLELRKRNGWEYVARPGIDAVVVVIAVTPDNEAVFVEQYREPVLARMIEWAAGLVGDEAEFDGEPLLDAANRELEEETGFHAGRMRVIGLGPSSGGMTSEVVTFVHAEDLRRVGEGGGVANEEIRVHLVPLKEADRWLDARVAEGMLIDPKVYAGLYFLSRRR